MKTPAKSAPLSEPKWTPGPHKTDGDTITAKAGRDTIVLGYACSDIYTPKAQAEANAKLWAAAAEMAAFLRRASKWAERYSRHAHEDDLSLQEFSREARALLSRINPS